MMETTDEHYIIASPKPWHAPLAAQMQAQVGGVWHLITTPEELTLEALQAIAPRYVFFPHWSHIIRKAIFEAYPCIVFHMTDLPYGRGGSPLQNLIARGHTQTMLSALRVETGLDTGPIYMKVPMPLHGTAEEILLRATPLMASMMASIVSLCLEPIPQVGEPTVFKRRTPADSHAESAPSLEALYDMIRMLDAPNYPPACMDIGAFHLEFTRAALKFESLIADVRITRR